MLQVGVRSLRCTTSRQGYFAESGAVRCVRCHAAPEVVRRGCTFSENFTHVLCVTQTIALSADHLVASGGGMSHLTTLAAERLRVVSNVLVVGQLTDSSTPLEGYGALRIADATFPLGLVHVAPSHVECRFIWRAGFVPAPSAMK